MTNEGAVGGITELIPGKLYQSGSITDYARLPSFRPQSVIVDLDRKIDANPPPQLTYIHWAVLDMPQLPDMQRMDDIADFCIRAIGHGGAVLSHCAAGLNRSSLLSGLIIHRLMGLRGPQVVAYLRQHRVGALSNETFARFLAGLT
ncbi:MAG: dual specificity protein phosphatase family protein [Chloroflexota bacterium]|nr:dual specificity protein phosphatase family protein [Chloroflexota bacterium]